MKKLQLLIIFLFTLASCQKLALPDQPVSNPVFYFKAANLPLWEAGRNHFYQEAALLTQNGYRVYIGKLENEKTLEALTVSLTDVTDTTIFEPIRSFGDGTYPYAIPNNKIHGILATFTANNSNQLAATQWHFGDGNTSTESNPSHFYPFTGMRRVVLRAQNLNNCVRYVSENIALHTNTDSSCSRDFTATADTSGNFTLNVINPAPATTYTWHIAGQVLQGSSVQYSPVTAGTNVVVLKINSNNGCTASVNGVLVFPAGIGCAAGFSTSLRAATIIVPHFKPGMVQISYRNKDGITFFSNELSQQPEHQFEIFRFEPYKTNSQNKPTYLLGIRFSCKLQTADGLETMEVKQGELYTAVEVPK